MTVLENIDRKALREMPAFDRVQAKKEITKQFIAENKDLKKIFLSGDVETRQKIVDKVGKKLGEKIPEFTQVKIGERESTSYYQMWPGGTGEPVSTTKPIMAPIYDEETETMFHALESGLVEPSELSKDEVVYFGMLSHERQSPLAKKMQPRARELADEIYKYRPESKALAMAEGAIKPLTDLAYWTAEKLGLDRTEGRQFEALQKLGYPKREFWETMGETSAMLVGGISAYRSLAAKGMGTVFSKEAGKLVLNPKALAATGAVEFGLGAAYNTPSIILGESDPNRLISGLEAMALGTAFNLGIDAMFPLKGMKPNEARQHIESLGKPDYQENLEKLTEGLKEQMTDLRPGSLPESRKVLPETAKTPEYTRQVEIDDGVKEIDRRIEKAKGRRGNSKKEIDRLRTQKQKLLAERVLLHTDPPLSQVERMAEEAMPGSVLGISPYGNLASMTPDQIKTLMLKDLSLRALTGTGASMYAEEEDRVKMFLLGSFLGGIPTIRAVGSAKAYVPKFFSEIKEKLNNGITPLDQRLHDLNPILYNVVRKKDMDTMAMAASGLRQVMPYIERVKRLVRSKEMTREQFNDLELALATRDESAREAIFSAVSPDGKLSRSYQRVQKTLKDYEAMARQANIEMGYLDNYFPLEMRDYPGFAARRGYDPDSEIERALKAFAEKKGKFVNQLTKQEKNEVANAVLGRLKVGRKPGYTQKRKITDLEHDDLKFYASSQEALANYIMRISDHIQTRHALGISGPGTNVNLARQILDDSVGGKITDWMENFAASGHITGAQIDEATDLFRSALLEAKSGAGSAVSAYRNLYYAMMMGNPYSAVTQLADVAMSAVKDPAASGTALVNAVKNKRFEFKMDDFGLSQIAEDMKSQSMTGKFLDRIFSAVGLKQMDALGKNSHLSAAYIRLRKQVTSSPEALKKFESIQKPRFAGDYNDLVNALRNGDKTNENVRLAVFNELADIQPITVTGMPKAYVDMKDGRILYALKSFTIKQFNFVRNHLYKNLKDAQTPTQYKDAMGDLLKYVLLVGGANMGINMAKDIALGRDFTMTDMMVNNLMQLMGLTRYNVYQAQEVFGGQSEKELPAAAANFLLPFRPVYDILDDIGAVSRGDVQDIQDVKSTRNVPLVGKDIYWRVGAGAEKERKKRAKIGEDSNFFQVTDDISINF